MLMAAPEEFKPYESRTAPLNKRDTETEPKKRSDKRHLALVLRPAACRSVLYKFRSPVHTASDVPDVITRTTATMGRPFQNHRTERWSVSTYFRGIPTFFSMIRHGLEDSVRVPPRLVSEKVVHKF